jgi:hypothetical protein
MHPQCVRSLAHRQELAGTGSSVRQISPLIGTVRL